MVGTDDQAVHRFRSAGEICASLQTQGACPDAPGPALPLRVCLALLVESVTPCAPSVAGVRNSPSPGNYQDWHSRLLAADQQAYSVAVITFKFSVAALLSLVPGRTFSRNQH